MPKIVPTKIKAQFEIEEAFQNTLNQTLLNTSSPKKPQQLYDSITEIYKPTYTRNINKNEANIKPENDFESTIRIKKEAKDIKSEESAFQTQINQRIT